MTESLVRSLLLGVACSLLTVWTGLAGESAVQKLPDQQGADHQSVLEYTKEWTDGFGNYHKDVYFAYIKNLTDEQGAEVAAEIWHGKATGFHQNGRKAWEAVYRHGKREGEFSAWSEKGVRTGLVTYEHGLMQGKYTQWSGDGRKMREENYDQGRLNGETRWWDGDGALVLTGIYRDGLPWTGTFADFDSSGTRTRSVVIRYERGQKVSQDALPGKWWW